MMYKKYFASILFLLSLFALSCLAMEAVNDPLQLPTRAASKKESYPNDLYIRRNLPPLMGQKLFDELLEGSIPPKKNPPTYHITLIIVKNISPHHGYRLKKRLNKIVNDSFSLVTFTPEAVGALQTEEDVNKVVALLPQENERLVFMKLNEAIVDAVKNYDAQHQLELQIHSCFLKDTFVPHLTVARSGVVLREAQRDALVESINRKLAQYVESNGKLFDLLHLDPALSVMSALPINTAQVALPALQGEPNSPEPSAGTISALPPQKEKELSAKQIKERADQQRAIVARSEKKVLAAQASLKAAEERDLANPYSKEKGKAAAKAQRKIMLAQRMIKKAEKKVALLEVDVDDTQLEEVRTQKG